MGRAPHVLSHFLGTRSLGTQCSLHYDACLEGWVWCWGALRPPTLPPPPPLWFISWNLLPPLAAQPPRGYRGIPPTYSFPTEERMSLALFSLKTTQI